ncbi:MAG: sugar ABC transporter ATP-binding protein [Verrucomicrobiota bacterium]
MSPPSPEAPPRLCLRGIVKSFPGVQALRGVDLRLGAGEVLAVLGENGAGKSTLMKVIGGVHAPDAGTLAIDGRERRFRSPQEARAAGVAVIHQEFHLIPALSAVENIFLGQEPTRRGLVDRPRERAGARAVFDRMGARLDLDAPCRSLSTAQQQLVEIARALAFEARLLVMDEPTTALTDHEVTRLFALISDLRRRGLGILYISHRLDEIFALADRVCILRDGSSVVDCPIGSITRDQIIERMVGRPLDQEFPARARNPGPPRLEVEGLRRGNAVRGVSFQLRRGEILALTGLVGAGRTETARLLFGADPRDAGEIRLDGRRLAIRSPRDAIAAGLGLLTEDRQLQGLILRHPVRENFGLPNLGRWCRRGFVQRGRERTELARYLGALHIRLADPEEPAGHLSGGNQQKVVLAKWLARDCEVLVFDEPTRGIDVGARHEIYQLMNDLVTAGKSILMISSELPEVLGMADRILVMHAGRITGEITDVPGATQAGILALAHA